MLPARVDTHDLPPPPGVFASIRAGFDAIALHIGLILYPLILDLLLWLGPRLSISDMMQPVLSEMEHMAAPAGIQAADMAAVVETYRTLLERFNLLVVLRTLPVGVSSLMSGRMPALSPLGDPPVVQIATVQQFLFLMAVLTVGGWLAGGLYFYAVAGRVIPRSPDGSADTITRALLQVLSFSVGMLIAFWILLIPAFFIIFLGLLINQVVAQVLLLLVAFVALWLVVPIFFSPQGIFVSRLRAPASVGAGIQLSRFTMPVSSLFVLTVLLVGVGLNYLWSIPAEDSWLALVGILGHAYISTALLAASFIYFKGMSSWTQQVMERIRRSQSAAGS